MCVYVYVYVCVCVRVPLPEVQEVRAPVRVVVGHSPLLCATGSLIISPAWWWWRKHVCARACVKKRLIKENMNAKPTLAQTHSHREKGQIAHAHAHGLVRHWLHAHILARYLLRTQVGADVRPLGDVLPCADSEALALRLEHLKRGEAKVNTR